jgi:transcriptional regulator with XRE-family HTH domain
MATTENRIAMLRHMADMTPRQLGERVRVGPDQIRRWESHREPVPDAYQALLAQQFEVSTEFLMGWPEGGA